MKAKCLYCNSYADLNTNKVEVNKYEFVCPDCRKTNSVLKNGKCFCVWFLGEVIELIILLNLCFYVGSLAEAVFGASETDIYDKLANIIIYMYLFWKILKNRRRILDKDEDRPFDFLNKRIACIILAAFWCVVVCLNFLPKINAVGAVCLCITILLSIPLFAALKTFSICLFMLSIVFGVISGCVLLGFSAFYSVIALSFAAVFLALNLGLRKAVYKIYNNTYIANDFEI